MTTARAPSPMLASSATSAPVNSSTFGSREAPVQSARASSEVSSASEPMPRITSCRSSSRLRGLSRSGTAIDSVCTRVLLQKIFLQERDRGVELKVRVSLLFVSVSLIVGNHVPHRSSLLLQSGRNLIRFAHRHARIIPASHHQHGFPNLLDVIHRRDPLQKLAHFRIA